MTTLLTGCSGDDGKGPEATLGPKDPTASASSGDAASPTPSPTDPNAAVKQAVLDTYDRMWAEQVKAYGKGSINGTALREYSAGPALADTQIAMDSFKEKGVVTRGAPTHEVTLSGLKPEKKVPWASLTDCLDTTAWKYVYKKTGKPVDMPKDQVLKYVTKVQAEKWGKSWKIVDVKPSNTSC
ncbi:hypothetical protein G3I40_27710 [Streptomyces sp. SID14478]|uniref:hypothetical protein n=1 Tax=Streptomyces sp. SID14478 TaxID=2706073 RepID=UPI0013DA663C|nr:hypothetical protein [Streptomyces sp. SID14478]NEB78977.1 hypothetical protein [Streptomyces sp. SID14478]